MYKYIALFLLFLFSSTANATYWTQWYDRDNPSGNGDYEQLQSLIQTYPGTGLCETPTGIECREVNGDPLSYSSQVVTCSTTDGFFCVNSQQVSGTCKDYHVRFMCDEVNCEELAQLRIEEVFAPCQTHHDNGKYVVFPQIQGAHYTWSIDYYSVQSYQPLHWMADVTNNHGGPFTLTVDVECGGQIYSISQEFESFCPEGLYEK